MPGELSVHGAECPGDGCQQPDWIGILPCGQLDKVLRSASLAVVYGHGSLNEAVELAVDFLALAEKLLVLGFEDADALDAVERGVQGRPGWRSTESLLFPFTWFSLSF